MRHRNKRTKQLSPWIQKRDLVVRNMVTDLIKRWQIKTTTKKAKVLKSEADKFFSHLISLFEKYEKESDARRIAISYIKWFINTEQDWKKVIDELIPKYKEQWKTTWFVASFKLWYRKWDWAEEVLIKLV